MSTSESASKWAPDASSKQHIRIYFTSMNLTLTALITHPGGPVLSENDIYFLESDLEVNPILDSEREKHRLAYLMFDLVNGAFLFYSTNF